MIPLPSPTSGTSPTARWLAAFLALLTAGLWLLPETAIGESRAAVHQYAIGHPLEMLPDSCADWLERDHWTAIRVRTSTAQFDRLCMAAGDAVSQSGLRRWGLSREGSPLGWLSGPLVYPDLISLLAGSWLLAAVVGGAFERRRGRRDLAIAVAASAVLPALAWWALAGLAAQPWLGAAALVSALLAAMAVLLSAEGQSYWLPGAAEPLELPMWSLLGWWLVLRLLSAALFGLERSALTAEMLALPAGAAIGFALRSDAGEALRRWLAQSKAQFDAAAAPVPVGPSLGPEVQAGRGVPPPSAAVARQDEYGPPTHEVDETLDGAEDPALAALFAEDLPAVVPAAVAAPATAAAMPAQAAALFARGAAKAEEAPSGRPAASAGLDDLLSELMGAAPPSPSPSGLAGPKAAPAASEVALPVVLAPVAARPAPAAPLEPAKATPRAEPTIAYSPDQAAALRSARAVALPLPAVRLAQSLRRGPDGGLQCLLDGEWEGLATDLVQGVAVGLVEHRDWPDMQPEIWIDVVTARASRQHPAEVVRLHLSRAALEEFAPAVPMARAFAQLAEELAAGGALCLPQQPLWPGPPWPRYATAGEFIAMWQRELGGTA